MPVYARVVGVTDGDASVYTGATATPFARLTVSAKVACQLDRFLGTCPRAWQTLFLFLVERPPHRLFVFLHAPPFLWPRRVPPAALLGGPHVVGRQAPLGSTRARDLESSEQILACLVLLRPLVKGRSLTRSARGSLGWRQPQLPPSSPASAQGRHRIAASGQQAPYFVRNRTEPGKACSGNLLCVQRVEKAAGTQSTPQTSASMHASVLALLAVSCVF